MAMVDKSGRLVRFTVRPGNAAENHELPTLLSGVDTNEVIADKAYDTNAIRLDLAASDIVATIPPKSNRRESFWYDPLSYRTRHLVENFFADLKQFRGIATRYCKLGESFAAFINIAGWYLETKAGRRTEKPPVYKKDLCPQEEAPEGEEAQGQVVEAQLSLAMGNCMAGHPTDISTNSLQGDTST